MRSLICESQGEALRYLGIQPISLSRPGQLAGLFIGAFALVAASACQQSPASAKKIEPTYNKKSGRLELLRYDSDGDGKFDTFSYMDGARIVRIEIDRNEDGIIDRWEYYGPGQKLAKIGFSRAGDGVEDAWSYPNAGGIIDRIEISTNRDGKANRTEHYDGALMVRAEEDTDGDGKPDKWETYDGLRLASVAFDTTHRGTPDRRLIYGADGNVRLEVDLQGTGTFVAVNEPRGPNPVPPRTPNPKSQIPTRPQ